MEIVYIFAINCQANMVKSYFCANLCSRSLSYLGGRAKVNICGNSIFIDFVVYLMNYEILYTVYISVLSNPHLL